VLSTPPVAAPSSRDRRLIWICIAILTALAWIYLIRLDRQMSASMAHDRMMAEMGMVMDMPRATADVVLTFVMWVVMMVAMMAGAATPMLLLFAGAQNARGANRVPMGVLLFGLGYLTVWVGFSAFAAIAQEALHRAAMLSSAMAASSQRASGVILVVAGAYQLTPFKGSCLTHCRSPLGFLMTKWREGRLGAFRMGFWHGGYCLGCCWALMCVLFAVGIMNLLWVAALSVLVLMEKVGPFGAVVGRIAGGAIIVLGIIQEVTA